MPAMAKKLSLFDDKPLEIQELTYIVKNDINSLNKQIAQLQDMTKSRRYAHGKHMQSHSNSVVVSLQSKLASMSNDFNKDVLKVGTENLKHRKHRHEQFTEGPVSATLPASAVARHAGSILLSDKHASSLSGDVAMDNIGPNQFQHQMQLIDEREYRHVQIGRVGYISFGKDAGKLCAIVDVIDQNRALVDGPCTGVRRQSVQFKRLRLTKFSLKFPRSTSSKNVRKAWEEEKITEQWNKTSTAKKMAERKLESNNTTLIDLDHERNFGAKPRRNDRNQANSNRIKIDQKEPKPCVKKTSDNSVEKNDIHGRKHGKIDKLLDKRFKQYFKKYSAARSTIGVKGLLKWWNMSKMAKKISTNQIAAQFKDFAGQKKVLNIFELKEFLENVALKYHIPFANLLRDMTISE